MLRRINDALPGLVLGIILYGILLQVTGVWFVPDKLGYTIGLWYGIGIAVAMAINMATMIYDSIYEDTGKQANTRVIAKSMFRYIVVVILFSILGYFHFGNLFMAFFGVMGLKISAYLQPLLRKYGGRWFRGRDLETPSENEVNEKINKEVTM